MYVSVRMCSVCGYGHVRVRAYVCTYLRSACGGGEEVRVFRANSQSGKTLDRSQGSGNNTPPMAALVKAGGEGPEGAGRSGGSTGWDAVLPNDNFPSGSRKEKNRSATFGHWN